MPISSAISLGITTLVINCIGWQFRATLNSTNRAIQWWLHNKHHPSMCRNKLTYVRLYLHMLHQMKNAWETLNTAMMRTTVWLNAWLQLRSPANNSMTNLVMTSCTIAVMTFNDNRTWTCKQADFPASNNKLRNLKEICTRNLKGMWHQQYGASAWKCDNSLNCIRNHLLLHTTPTIHAHQFSTAISILIC